MPSGRTRDKVREDRVDGRLRKRTTDELGNTVTQWARGPAGSDTTGRDTPRQDVHIQAPHIRMTMSQEEIR